MKNLITTFLFFVITSFVIAQGSLDSGLVAYYPFNGNANDESGSGNNGTVLGLTLAPDRFGIDNRAYSFDGVNDYISIADNPNLFSDELTISWWYKLTETPGGAWVVIGWVDGGHRYKQFFSGNQLCYFNGYNLTAPGLYFNPTYNLPELNVWKHVVVTYQKTSASTSTTSIFVDGELKQTDNHTLAMDYAPGIEFKIGKNVNGNFFKGYLDDFRIYNRILNSSEILALYQDSTTLYPDSLIAYFPFNGNANDSSFLHNNGTVTNALLTTDRYGNDDNAYYFNGADSRIQVPQNSFYNFGNGDFTFSSWINVSVIGTSRIVSAGYQENDNIWGLGFGTHP
ncbi:MAG: LamG domain-containing protein, partial [Ignavibacterium sp.]